jgi:hypothetical protein
MIATSGTSQNWKQKRTLLVHTPSFVHGGQVGATSLVFQLVKFRQKIGIKKLKNTKNEVSF